MNNWKNFFNVNSEIFVEAAGKILGSVFIIIIFYGLYALIKNGLSTLKKREILPFPIERILVKMVKYLFTLFAIFLILQHNGVSLNVLWTTISAIIAMIAVGFVAVWSVISNTLCTLLLLITKPFRIGDRIELIEPSSAEKGAGGKVINISMFYTTLQEAKETNSIMIPNNMFFQKIIRRYEGETTYGLDEQLFNSSSLISGKKNEKKNKTPKTKKGGKAV